MRTIFESKYIFKKNIYVKLIHLIAIYFFIIASSCNNHEEKQNHISGNAIAFAYPVEPIVVDGDISDWPKDISRYPINNLSGEKPVSEEDLKANFQVAYNPQERLLYFAVKVTDDTHETDTAKNAQSFTQDSYNLYLNNKNTQPGSGVISYSFNEVWKKLIYPKINWDPNIQNANWDNIQIACKRKGSATIYECSIMLEGEINPGRAIGADHTICDKDNDGLTFIAWGQHDGKEYISRKLGFIILMNEKEKTGEINGQLVWKDDSIIVFPNQVKVESLLDSGLCVKAFVDSSGVYTAKLPEGSYQVSIVDGYVWQGEEYIKIDKNNSKAIVNVKPNTEKTAPPLNITSKALPNLIPEIGIMHNFNDEKAGQLDKFIKTYQQYYEIPGVSLALIKDGQIIYHNTYGQKNTYTKELVNDSTLFEAGSTTKPVFAYAVCRLAEKGIIDLDKPLYQYLPFEDIAHDERYKLITARHALCHQTGFPNWPGRDENGQFNLKFTPGTDFGYSGEAFEYLKRVVVHITQKDIGTILEEEVLTPLNLKNMYFQKSEYLAKVASHGHFNNLPTNIRLINSPQMAYSMSTEAKSFARFVLGLNNRKGLKPETYDEMLKIQTVIPLDDEGIKPGWDENYYYGLGLKLENSPHGLVFGHSGSTSKGFICNFAMFDELNMGYVIFTNSYGGAMLVLSPLTEFLITGKGK